jgi:hypothetical protein
LDDKIFEAVAVTLSIVLGLLWVPIGYFFYKSWRERRNPISLAIVGLIFVSIWTDVTTWLLLHVNWKITLVALRAVNALAMVNFYLSIRWANRKWHTDETRKPSN